MPRYEVPFKIDSFTERGVITVSATSVEDAAYKVENICDLDELLLACCADPLVDVDPDKITEVGKTLPD